jgi:hypothetical protein
VFERWNSGDHVIVRALKTNYLYDAQYASRPMEGGVGVCSIFIIMASP